MSSFSLSGISKKLKGGDRPPFEKFYWLVFIIFCGYLIGDLTTLYVRQHLLPTTFPAKRPAPAMANQRRWSFSEVIANNIFNSDRKIPPSLGEIEGGAGGEEGAPRLSQLPLELIGTIVHANPNRSLATVMLKGQSKVEPYSVGQNIEDMAEVKEIKRERLIFRNLRTQVLEYIEIPQDAKITLSTERPFNASPAKAGGEKTEFSFKREEIEKQLENLPALLQAARVVPEFAPDGQPKGFRLVEMQPGSIYEKLGLKIGDVIKGVNGEAITNPQKAMEMYQLMRSADDIKLQVERNGTDTDLSYKLTR